ncbi:MAG TPA: hypothetical protein VFU38_04965 [Candidatus Krumholzibacteria bacterium]|nr:hypothetical protein [Candidatus Krumholzibacteria bacterium]
MTTVACELAPNSLQTHLQQIYTGFVLLHRSGRIRLTQRVGPPPAPRPGPQHLRDAPSYRLLVRIDGRVQVLYDVHDSWEIDDEVLDVAHVYFKRSFSPAALAAMDAARRRKVRPLGLNYALYPDGADRFGVERAWQLAHGAARWKEAARALAVTDAVAFTPRASRMWSEPDPSREPRALFMARTFDLDDAADRSAEKVAQRATLNDDRAATIRALRSALGNRFYGGFTHTRHAIRNYRDVLLPDPGRGTKGGYIRTLREYPVCVATTGIHGSIGWKFAEYVAFAKAVASEPLTYVVPGDLAPGRHYLEFRGVDECVQSVVRLIEDRALCAELMANNASYYQQYLRPDRLVWNTIEAALAR